MLNLVKEDKRVGLITQFSACKHAQRQIELFQFVNIAKEPLRFIVSDKVHLNEILEKAIAHLTNDEWLAYLPGSLHYHYLITAGA